jgi:hypothetical protein
MTMGYQ